MAYVKCNTKLKTNSVVTPEKSMEDIRPMDNLGIDIGKFGGRSYIIIAMTRADMYGVKTWANIPLQKKSQIWSKNSSSN